MRGGLLAQHLVEIRDRGVDAGRCRPAARAVQAMEQSQEDVSRSRAPQSRISASRLAFALAAPRTRRRPSSALGPRTPGGTRRTGRAGRWRRHPSSRSVRRCRGDRRMSRHGRPPESRQQRLLPQIGAKQIDRHVARKAERRGRPRSTWPSRRPMRATTSLTSLSPRPRRRQALQSVGTLRRGVAHSVNWPPLTRMVSPVM